MFRPLLQRLGILETVPAISPWPTDSALHAASDPDPTDVHQTDGPPGPHPYMWYYRTTVTNTGTKPLQIIEFGCDAWTGKAWEPQPSILARPLTGRDFGAWYDAGDAAPGGLLAPGASAVDARNWHGGEETAPAPRRWWYIAESPDGTRHRADTIVRSVALRLGRISMKRACCGGESDCNGRENPTI